MRFLYNSRPRCIGAEEKETEYDEQVDEIIAAHTETVDALKEQRDQYKADAEKLPEIQKQLDKANADLESAGKDAYKVKYEALKEEYEGYKNEQTAKETRSAKERAYRELLRAAGVTEKRIDSVIRVSDLDGLELDDKGAIKDADKLTESIKTEWADFIPTTTTQGAQTATPPTTTTQKTYTAADIRKMSPAEINQNFDAICRNQVIHQDPAIFPQKTNQPTYLDYVGARNCPSNRTLPLHHHRGKTAFRPNIC